MNDAVQRYQSNVDINQPSHGSGNEHLLINPLVKPGWVEHLT